MYPKRTKMQSILALTGHKSNINCIDAHPFDSNLFVSWFSF